MKASLPPIKKTRLPWFKEKCQVEVERDVEISYYMASMERDFNSHTTQRRYIFNLANEREIPSSDVILMSVGMPFLNIRTQGNIGQKLPTVRITDPTILVEDRIMEREKGRETVTIEDTPYPDKIQETRVREDVISRKITLKNELGKDASVKVRITESADIQLVSMSPDATTIDKPHYFWQITVPKDADTHIQCKYRIRIEKVRQLPKPVEKTEKKF